MMGRKSYGPFRPTLLVERQSRQGGAEEYGMGTLQLGQLVYRVISDEFIRTAVPTQLARDCRDLCEMKLVLGGAMSLRVLPCSMVT